MSLIAWYPLNGDTLDYSGNQLHATNNGTTIDNNGKIGKTYLFNGSNNNILTPLNSNMFNQVSISFWVYNYNAGGVGLIGTHSGGRTLNFYRYPTLNDFHWSTQGSGGVDAGVLPFNKWTHITVVCDGSSLKRYYNGVYYGVTAGGVARNASAIYIGSNDSGYSNVKLNDIRIYDHALSEKEIVELQKPKVLHYRFDHPYSSGVNEVYNSTYNIYNNAGVPATLTKLDETYMGMHIYRLTMTPTESSLSSFRSTLHSRGIYGFHRTFLANTKYIFTVLWRPVSHQDVIVGGTASNIAGWKDIQSFEYQDDWFATGQHRNHTITQSDNIFTSFYTPSAQVGVPITIDFCGPRLLVGTNDFKPYPFFNLTYNTVYDYSGYQNNIDLKIAEEPVWIENSPIGSGAYLFNGSNQLLHSNKQLHINPNELTLSAWVCPMGAHSSDRGIIVQQNGNFYLTLTTDQKVSTYWYDTSNEGYHTTEESLTLNNWYLITAVWDGTTHKIYINGELEKEIPITTPGRTTSSKANVSVGGEPLTAPNRCFNGAINDVRIYSVALNDQDIQLLYEKRLSLDENHNLTATQVIELSKFNPSMMNSNLIKNGFGEYSDNTNFPTLAYNALESSFTTTSSGSQFNNSDFIKISGNGTNQFDQYKLEGWFKQPEGTLSRYFLMLFCYDKDKQWIEYRMAYHRPGTETVLARSLEPGDSIIYLTEGSNWFDNGNTTYTHYKQFKITPHGYHYPPYTYSRITGRYLRYDATNHALYLNTPWSGDSYPAGTAICNTNDGGTYSYIASSNALMTRDWVYRSGISSSIADVNSMRYGTEYVRIGCLINRDAGETVTSHIKNLSLTNVTNYGQASFFGSDLTPLKNTGELLSNEFSEIGLPVRYIRESMEGSSANTSNHWVEIHALSDGVNVALCKPVYGAGRPNPSGYSVSLITDGSWTTTPYAHDEDEYVTIDLGDVYIIDELRIWHYWGDGRTYKHVNTEISIDGDEWVNVFSSENSGEYAETQHGHSIPLSPTTLTIEEINRLRTHEFREV